MDDEQAQPPGITRRGTLAGTLAAGTAGLALAVGATQGAQAQGAAQAPDGQETARGTVFEDGGGTGRRGADRSGIPGVMVSNGRDVAVTDADGRWSLPVLAGDALFVVKPTGWATPVDPATQLPRFSYLHVPEGTPASLGLRYAGIPPTGPLPDSIDFPLRRQQEPSRFDVLLFTDPQPESLAEVGYVRDDVAAQAAGIGAAAFGITLGDVAFDDLSVYERQNRIIGSIGLPWYSCCGNHDMNLESPDDAHSRETFKRVFGARHHAFQYGGATFLILDNVDYLGADPTKPNGSGRYEGRFGADQLRFVRGVLANVPRDALVVACFHIPLRTQQGTQPGTANTDTRAFLEAVSTHPATVSFSGHTHTNEHWYLDGRDGYAGGGAHHHHVLAAVSGSWWSGPFDERGIPVALQSDGCPNGFHVLSVDGNRCATRFVPARDPSGVPLRIVLDSQLHRDAPEVMRGYRPGTLLAGPIARDAAGSTRVVVNLFDGGPRSEVSMQIGRDAVPVAMTRAIRRDPFVEEVYARNQATRKPWVHPALSTHLWQATLPADLPAGTHRITVRAKDEHGREHTTWMVLEVTA